MTIDVDFVVLSFLCVTTVLCGDYCSTDGFMSLDSIQIKSPFCFNEFPNTVKPVAKGLYLMPEMNFTCHCYIKSVLVGARYDTMTDDMNPQIQIWRREPRQIPIDNNSYTQKRQIPSQKSAVMLVSSHVINFSKNHFTPTAYSYYNFVNPIEVNDGDFIGFYQPSNNTIATIYYTNDTFIDPQTVYTTSDADKLSPNITNATTSLSLTDCQTIDNFYLLLRPQTDDFKCLKGFLDYGEVKTRSNYINSLTYNHKQLRLFPNIKFNCNGFVRMVTFGAQTRNGLNNILLPELQIWRKLSSSTSHSYIMIHSIVLSKNESSRTINVHNLYLNIPIEFSKGDFIGLYQPDIEKSELVLFYQQTNGPENLVLMEQPFPTAVSGLNTSGANDYPLVTVRIEPSSSTAGTIINSSPTISSSPNIASSDLQIDLIIIIVSIISGLAVIILIAIVATVIVSVCLKIRSQQEIPNLQKEQNSSSIQTMANNNPVSSQARNVEFAISSNYDECVDLQRNRSYGVSNQILETALNPSYNTNISRGDNNIEDYEDYILPMPSNTLSSDDQSVTHKYY